MLSVKTFFVVMVLCAYAYISSYRILMSFNVFSFEDPLKHSLIQHDNIRSPPFQYYNKKRTFFVIVQTYACRYLDLFCIKKQKGMKLYGDDRKLLSLTELQRGKIEYLSLIDTRIDKVLISSLSNGSIVDIDAFNVSSVTDLTINVVLSNIVFGIESIKFMTGSMDNRTTYVHIEGNAPFALCGNYQYDFSSCPLDALIYGTNVVTVTTHSKEGGLGETVETYQVAFTIHGKDPIATPNPSKSSSSNPSTTPSMMETKNNGTKKCTFPEVCRDNY